MFHVRPWTRACASRTSDADARKYPVPSSQPLRHCAQQGLEPAQRAVEIGIVAQRLDALDRMAHCRAITREGFGDFADAERENDVREVHRDLPRKGCLRGS